MESQEENVSFCDPSQIADFCLKCSILFENPKNNVTGSNLRTSGLQIPPKHIQGDHRFIGQSLKTG